MSLLMWFAIQSQPLLNAFSMVVGSVWVKKLVMGSMTLVVNQPLTESNMPETWELNQPGRPLDQFVTGVTTWVVNQP